MSGDGFVLMGDTLEVRVEEDLVFVRNHRVMTLRDLHLVTDVYQEVRARHGRLLALYDSSRSEGIDREARRALTATVDARAEADATAIFGASFAIRTLSNMIDRAIVGLGRPSIGIKLFASEAEARAHLNQARERILASRSSK